MKYKVSNITPSTCSIALVAENSVEMSVLQSPEEQDTFLFHYQQALNKHIHPDATYVDMIDDTNYPKSVVVKYQRATGIGGY